MENLKKIYKILSKKQKINFLIVSLFTFFITILELMGIGLIFPVISSLTNPSVVQKIISEYDFLSFFRKYDHNETIIVLLLLTILFYFTKTILITVASYLKAKRFYGLGASLSESMFQGYIGQPLSFMVPQNSAYITRNIIDFPNALINNVLFGIFTVFCEIFFIFGTLLIFIKVNYNIGLLISIFTLLFILVFYYFNKKGLSVYGKKLNDRYAERTKVAREAIEGLKDINLYNRKDFFNKIYGTHNYKIVGITALFEIRQLLPKFLLEFLAVLFICLSIFFLLKSIYTPSEIVPIIGVIAAGLIKAIPSTAKLLSSLQRIKSSEHVVNTMSSELAKFRKITINQNALKAFSNQIEVNNISFRYPGSDFNLEKINFSIKKNIIFGIKGKSGSGKSTCLNLISGFLNPTGGSLMVDGQNIQDNVSNWQKLISYIPQKVFLTDDTLRNNICFGLGEEEINQNILNKVIKLARIDEFANVDNGGLDRMVGERGSGVSVGQMQRIGLARALYKEPKILILDESTSALDKSTEEKILNDIVKLKKDLTIIIVSHSDSVISICDSYYDLDKQTYEYH